MTEETLQIEKWKKGYSFLKDVWNSYDEFDRLVDYDTYKHNYDVVCQRFIELSDGDIKKHKNFCMKLLRNLGHYSHNLKILNFKSEECTNLNNWVYNSMKKYDIPDKIITECFDDYKTFMGKINEKPRCSYYPYDAMYEEPINIIKLNIFESNMDIVHNKLDSAYDSINLPLRMYICECIDIYKEMYRKHCLNKYDQDPKRVLTCSTLDTVKKTYDIFLSGRTFINYIIPSLVNDEEKYLAMCKPDKPRLALTAKLDEKIPVLGPTTHDEDRYSGAIPHLSPVTNENQGSSMPRTVSTAFGTVAGASSVLALLYKFTPGGKWIRSGIRGGRGRISNNLYRDAPNELLFNGIQGEDMSSYNERYNIGYGSV